MRRFSVALVIVCGLMALSAPTASAWAVLGITKTADQPHVNAGSPIGFTVTVTNTGTFAASDVQVTDPLPSGPDISWSIDKQTNPGFCLIVGSPPAQAVDCNLFLLNAGGSFSFHVTSNTTTGSCQTYLNAATVFGTDTSDGELLGPFTASASTTVTCQPPPPCPQGTKANFRWHFIANGSSGSWSATKSATCPGTVTIPSQNWGAQKLNAGGLVTLGYSVTTPGSSATMNITNATVTTNGSCTFGGSNVVHLPDEPNVSVNGGGWVEFDFQFPVDSACTITGGTFSANIS
jgi:uncharacterized repeat protein (TIGR01451 family)